MTERDDSDPSALIDATVADADDWRGHRLAQLRKWIHEAVPDVVEEVKWRKPSNPNGVPTWNHNGIICTGEIYKDKVKLTFARGASLPDPDGLFNSTLDGEVRRAIDVHEDEELDEEGFKDLIRSAAEQNEPD